MSHNMKSNFYPAKEPKNGYIGMADVTVSNAIRIHGIGVFENRDGNGYHIQFPGFGEGKDRHDYVIPLTAEARAEFVNVVTMAVNDQEKHFGWASGRQDPYFDVSGRAVTEPYADARFFVKVDDLCVLHGISTREVNYVKDGKPDSFIAVDLPDGTPYEKDGEMVYPTVYEALRDGTVYNKTAGKEEHKDFEALLNNLVRAERTKVLNRHPSLDDQVKDAEHKSMYAGAEKEEPVLEPAR